MGRVKKSLVGTEEQKLKKAEVESVKQKLKKEFKKKAVRVRDRTANISEQKLSCPVCGIGNKTYRVLVQHCKEDHLDMQLALICCREKCGWYCSFSLTCWQHHMLYEHGHKVDGSDSLHLLKHNGDFSDHSLRCFRTMKERKNENQHLLKLRIEMDYCRREAKRFIAYAIGMGRLLYPDICEEFPKEDHAIILEMYDHETYLKLTKKYPMPDHMILDNLLNPAPNKWDRLVAENIAIHIFKERAEARIEEL